MARQVKPLYLCTDILHFFQSCPEWSERVRGTAGTRGSDPGRPGHSHQPAPALLVRRATMFGNSGQPCPNLLPTSDTINSIYHQSGVKVSNPASWLCSLHQPTNFDPNGQVPQLWTEQLSGLFPLEGSPGFPHDNGDAVAETIHGERK